MRKRYQLSAFIMTVFVLLGITGCGKHEKQVTSVVSSDASFSSETILSSSDQESLQQSSSSAPNNIISEIISNKQDVSSMKTQIITSSDISSKYELKVVAEKQTVDIIRQDADCNRRLVYLKFTNYEGITHKNPKFVYTDAGKTVQRDLATIYLNNKVVYDTIWVASTTKSITGKITDESGKIIWEGTLNIVQGDREHLIKKSKVYALSEIKPASLRGVNYYPRWTPWSAWTKQKESTWDSEFKEMSEKLNVNIIRTFAELWEEDQKFGWCATPEYLETISKLFAVADKYKIKVLFCLHSHLPSQFQGENVRYVRSIMEPFINDGRVFGWDLINEIDSKGLSEVEYIDAFCQEFNMRMSEFDPNHPNCIGFAYMLEKAGKAGLHFDGPQQFWQYHWYRDMTADTIAGVADRYFGKTPFLLGECGDSSMEGVSDAPRPDTGEDWQLSVYQTIIPAVIGAKDKGYDIKGVMAWTAFEFPNMLNQETGQGEYGLIRANGELKPAGKYLGSEFLKLKKSNPAQWD